MYIYLCVWNYIFVTKHYWSKFSKICLWLVCLMVQWPCDQQFWWWKVLAGRCQYSDQITKGGRECSCHTPFLTYKKAPDGLAEKWLILKSCHWEIWGFFKLTAEMWGPKHYLITEQWAEIFLVAEKIPKTFLITVGTNKKSDLAS